MPDTRTSTSKDTDAHTQSWHGVIPPYIDPVEVVHECLHNDGAELRDRDHKPDDLKAGGRS